MHTDFSEEHSSITFISEYNGRSQDHIDRAVRNLKDLQRENELIRREMEMIKSNPKAFIKPIRDELANKINKLRDENESLRKMVQKSKIPAYCEMTKKKIVNTEQDERESMRQSIRGSFRPRNPLDEIESNFDKNDATSTCLNYNTNPRTQNSNYVVGPNDQQSRNALTTEIRLLLEKAEAFEEELERINKRQKEVLKKNSKRDEVTEAELAKIYEYKKKLISILSKLRNRQSTMNELIKTYRVMHEETLDRLREATATLERIRQAQISEDVDQKYAEVLQLQERLQSINAQLQQMNQTKWLQEIAKELATAVRRMGLQIPKVENTRELINQLCQILIECHLSTKKDGQSKLVMLKQYHEEEKINNSKYIAALKSKEQALGRRLIDLQMQK